MQGKEFIMYGGHVADRNDLTRQGQIRARLSFLPGSPVSANWARSLLHSFYYGPPIPPNGHPVRLLFEAGDPNRQWWLPANPTRDGRPYQIPAEVRELYPDVSWFFDGVRNKMVMSSKGGQRFIQFEDGFGFGMRAQEQKVYLGNVHTDPALALQMPAVFMGPSGPRASTRVFISQ